MNYNAFKKVISLFFLATIIIACEKNNVSKELPQTKVFEKNSNGNCITLDQTSFQNYGNGFAFLQLTTTNISGVNAVYPQARNFKFLNLPSGLNINANGGSLGTFQTAGQTRNGLVRLSINGNIPSDFVLQFSFETRRYTNCNNNAPIFGSVLLK
ncbi:hypothetical protein IWQ47_000817 [Aquimarina sp. EL_43]|uniref:hypothetical protein n=1 Tax=unclassified Aquimarina TaxID=2627091 RepID=UPI0018CA9649|nr:MULTISPECIES: hypothetical protein [unclassified Aquimarina]MBG6129881.1 hypothetical protein [Aquimarina sp. EL_35]MBG6150946.1 hypothetical protein [Aquimarina sp. EL_32]MBG6167747.1 hypothetical protein [Aquimarina sp. EL_43]